MKFPKHRRLGYTRIAIHTIEGATDSFSIPEQCRITFSLLTTPNIRSETVKKNIIAFAKKSKINLVVRPVERKTPYGESYEINTKNPFVKQLEKKIFSANNVKPIYTASVADENIFANRLKIPVVSIGPIGGGGHTEEEWLDLSSLGVVEGVYKSALQLYVKFDLI